ncbi:MAG: hypothetical protein ACOZNI_13420 [Myxococcota bacterium]
MAVGEAVGRALGHVLAPLFVAGTKLRRARVFHPGGRVWHAEVEAASDAGAPLAGPALVRIGGAAWRGEDDLPDVLGLAVRFGEGREGHVDGEVDVSFATFRTPLLLPAAFFTTDRRDYLTNTYWAGVPYDVGGRVAKLRAVPVAPSPPGPSRGERLAAAVAAGDALFVVEADGRAIARVKLLRRAEVDEAKLRFAPYAGGRGLAPRGMLTAMRQVVYPKCQDARA